MTSIIEKLLEVAEGGARAIIRNKRNDPDFQLMPTFIGMAADGKTAVIGASFGTEVEKHLSLLQVRKLFREHNVIAYALVTEAWTSSVAADSPEGLAARKHGKWPKVRPSEDPNRREILSIGATDGTMNHHRVYAIERDGRGCMTGIVLENEMHAGAKSKDLGDGEYLSGRMFDLLGDRTLR